MSKAFTKEDDDGGFETPKSSALSIPSGPFRLTARGARIASASEDERVREAARRAEILERVDAPKRASLGVTVVVETEAGEERRYRLVSAEERALIGEGCSIDGPIGRALLGVEEGDVREVALPRGIGGAARAPMIEQLEIVKLEGE